MSHILVTGAGLSGAVIARSLAEKNYKVTVIDERAETGGNCRDYRDEQTGINIHQYGPHIFHTDIKEVWDYANKYAEFVPYTNRVKARTEFGSFSLPVNLLTLSQRFGKQFSPKEAFDFVQSKADKSITEPKNFKEKALSLMGEELYNTFFSGYTLKQWGRNPEELPASILSRLPFRFNFDDNYFTHPYQGMPKDGYSAFIDNILNHPNIKIELNKVFDRTEVNDFDHVFYSGQLDRYFNYEFGRLEYRTLDFEKFYPIPEDTLEGDFQGGAVVNYCSPTIPWTRITEHKHFSPWESHEKTVCYKEFSRNCEENDLPYYPVRLSGKNTLLEKYTMEAKKLSGITFVGRLGLYKYFDMDKTIDAALKTVCHFEVNFKKGISCSLAFAKLQ
jgi:UDP-galactopyranose mutase